MQVIKPLQMLEEDPANLRFMMASVSFLVLILTSCMLEGLLVFVQFGDIELIGNFL